MPETAPHTVAPNPSPGRPLSPEAESLWHNPLAHELRGPGEWSVDERNAWLDHTLDDDPNRPLPAVRFQPELPTSGEAHFTGLNPYKGSGCYIYSPEGKEIGTLMLCRPTNPAIYGGSDKHFIRHIQVYDREHGHGYGPATYLQILKLLPAGAGLRTEGVLSEDARRVWEGMVAKGVARPSDKGGTPTAYETVF